VLTTSKGLSHVEIRKNLNLHRIVFKALWRHTAAASFGASLVVFAVGASAQTPSREQAPAKNNIPDLASAEFGWLAYGVHWFDPPPGLGRGPIRQDPAYPFHSNVDGPGQVTPDIGYTKDPVLKPWAAKQMQESNDEVLSGKRGLPFVAQATCHPGGVPGQLLTPAAELLGCLNDNDLGFVLRDDLGRLIARHEIVLGAGLKTRMPGQRKPSIQLRKVGVSGRGQNR
jgi:hypothetical protein